MGTTNGICIALLVAIKQLIPDHEIGSSTLNVTANYLPLIYMTLVVLLTSLSFFRIGVLVFTCAAFEFAWVYLRYFRFNPTEAVYGDLSDTFAYSTMFPPPVRPAASIVANVAFVMFRPLLMAVQPSDNQQQQQQQQDQPQQNGDVKSTFKHLQPSSKASSMDTERRRQRALKLLDERIQSAATANNNNKSEIEHAVSTSSGTDSAV